MDACRQPDETSAPAGLHPLEYRYGIEQAKMTTRRIGALQQEREVWIRYSLLATAAAYGWIVTNGETAARSLMLDMSQAQAIHVLPLALNIGGALRFAYLQRDIRLAGRELRRLERDVLQLPPELQRRRTDRLASDRDWHPPSLAYWLTINLISAAGFLVFGLGLPAP